MELRIANRLKATGQTIRVKGKTRDAASSAGPQPRTDRFVLSRQVAEHLEAQNRLLMDLARKEDKKPALWELDEESGENAELKALGESMKTMERCHKIAARIMRGDKVPPQDERYLMLNDPDGYKLAMAMRTPKRNPKKWKSVLKEEDQDAEARQSGGESTEAASCEEAGESAGSGEGGGTAGESQ